jgi:hypothetical protein
VTDSYRELLIGCGHARDKRILAPNSTAGWQCLVTLDQNADCHPNIVCDLDNSALAWRHEQLQDNQYDEIHAYEVLEHLGQQGNARSFFWLFTGLWNLLKPDGYLCATVPSRYSPWLWGDPSHRRAILPESLVFLDQSEYVRQLDGPRKTAMSDFRSLYRADFQLVDKADNRETFSFILQALKPSRWGVPLT